MLNAIVAHLYTGSAAMKITNIVTTATVTTQLDLTRVAQENINIVYNPQRFTAASWRHRCINGTLLLFPNGKLIHLGPPSHEPPRKHIRRYARLLQKQGHPVHLGPIHCVCMSAVHSLSGQIDLHSVAQHFHGSYEPEILNAALFKRGTITACVFRTGTVNFTGIRKTDKVFPLILELELLVA